MAYHVYEEIAGMVVPDEIREQADQLFFRLLADGQCPEITRQLIVERVFGPRPAISGESEPKGITILFE
jgi:hypothetical protein